MQKADLSTYRVHPIMAIDTKLYFPRLLQNFKTSIGE